MMAKRIHFLCMKVDFPAGIAPGEGSDFNTLAIARRGDGKPVLRGTAIAGALRSGWATFLKSQGKGDEQVTASVNQVFGFASDKDNGHRSESRLRVSDAVLDVGSDNETVMRTHHLRSRHTGAVVDGGLFSLEACPRGTSTRVGVWLRDDEEQESAAIDFLSTIVAMFRSGIVLGGKSARGIGIARLDESAIVHRRYELSDATEHAAYLNSHRAWRQDPTVLPEGKSLKSDAVAPKVLTVTFTLAIPRGQDLLVGDGQAVEREMEPQRVRAADGKYYWRLPGASLRGLFRDWISRLAARDDLPVADNATRHRDEMQERAGNHVDGFDRGTSGLSGENLGWCFLPRSQRKQGEASTDCVVADLFGSLFQAGRIHIADAYAECSNNNGPYSEEQSRMHVAVDRISGGAAESMLFENTVLTANGASPDFEVTMRIRNPKERESEWLAKTLRALHVGVLRVGSSKSSGRLELVRLTADGPCVKPFEELRDALKLAN